MMHWSLEACGCRALPVPLAGMLAALAALLAQLAGMG